MNRKASLFDITIRQVAQSILPYLISANYNFNFEVNIFIWIHTKILNQICKQTFLVL